MTGILIVLNILCKKRAYRSKNTHYNFYSEGKLWRSSILLTLLIWVLIEIEFIYIYNIYNKFINNMRFNKNLKRIKKILKRILKRLYREFKKYKFLCKISMFRFY